MNNLNLKEATGEELDILQEDMYTFRDSGCRILTSASDYSPLLVDRISGHLIIGPFHQSRLGFEFSIENRTKSAPFPQIRKFPYSHCPNLFVHIGHRDYLLFETPESLDAEGSLVRGRRDFYGISHAWMLETGAIKVSR